MKWEISNQTLQYGFAKLVQSESEQKIAACYQCGKCSAGCPVAYEMDYIPSQIIRMVQLGMREPVLNSRTIWLCASCETCTTRCPREIELTKIMDTLRIIAQREKIKYAEKHVVLFNRLFLDNIRKFGRLFEVVLIRNYNLRSGNLFKDVLKSPQLILKGKIALFPPKLKNRKVVQQLHSKITQMEK